MIKNIDIMPGGHDMTGLSDTEVFAADQLLGQAGSNLGRLLGDELSRWDRERFVDGLLSLQRRGLVIITNEGNITRAVPAESFRKALAA